MDFETTQTRRARSAGLTAFAVRLAKLLSAARPDHNLVFSPLSIYAALSLVAAGAAGDTLAELLAVLGARSRDDLAEFVSRMAESALADTSGAGGPCVAFACGVWCDAARQLKPAYRDAVVGTYKAEATTVDFKNKTEEARKQINAWALQVTRNLIDSILPPGSIQPSTAVMLGNAIYFKGNWYNPFKEMNTKRKPFYRLDGRAVANVPYMSSSNYQSIAVHDGFKVLKLPYRTPQDQQPFSRSLARFSMCIFLPDSIHGLPSLVEKIASRPEFLQEHLPAGEPSPVREFRVPKFKLSFVDRFAGVLQELGLRLPFSKEDSDLSEMVEDDGSGFPLFVDDILHKAVIEVNEEGTEAAAVTMTRCVYGCARLPPPPPPPVDFVADHPFAYFIVEEMSRAIVFAGHVVDPSME